MRGQAWKTHLRRPDGILLSEFEQARSADLFRKACKSA
jgi:hypothetical protein